MPLDQRMNLHRPIVMAPGGGSNSGMLNKIPNPTNLVELFITHVQDDGPLIKINAQNDRMAAVFVERLILSYKANFEKYMGQPKSVHQLTIGLLCCAKYHDSNYYRARILEFVGPDNVSVVFVDYGNTTVISIANIRLLENLGPDQALANIHDLASEYLLAGIVPRKPEWEPKAIEFMEQKLCYVELRCQIISEVFGKKLIRILLNDVDFTHILVQNNLGFPLPIQAYEVLVSGIYGKMLPPDQFSIPPPPIPRVLPPSNPIQTHRDSSAYSSVPPRFISEMLVPGSEHLVYVSHVEDGPFTFAVQLKAVAEKALTKLMAELNDHKPKPISGPLIPGSVCLGRFSEDQSLCRAIVMNVFDDKCKLYYADYGNSEVLPYSEIFEVPPQHVGLKVMALRFTLANIRGQVFSDDVKAFFKQLVTDKQVVIKVTPPEASPLKQYCEMFIEGCNVKQMIREKVMAEQPLTYSKLHTPVKGTKEKVMVSYVESTKRFFVQFNSNQEALSTVMTCLAGHCQRGAPLLTKDKLRPGITCCALYPVDQTWYRAQILSVEDNMATVLFVDYGNQDTVSVTALRQINHDLVTKVRTQALECCLNGYHNSEPEQAISNLLEELTLEKEFTMQVVDVTRDQIPIVNLYDENQTSVVSKLLPPRVSQTTFASPPATADPIPKPAPVKVVSNSIDDEWNEDEAPQQQIRNDYDSRSGNDGFKKSSGDDSANKPWRSQENGDERGGRFGREEKGGSWRDKDDNKTSWRNKENEEKKRQFGRVDDDSGNKWGRDKDENSRGRFNKGDEDRGKRFGSDRDANSGGGFKSRKFDKDDDNEGRRFGRNRDTDSDDRAGGDKFSDRGSSGRFGDRGGGRKFEDKGGSDFRRNKFENRDGGSKRDSSGDSFKKPYDRGDSGRTFSRGGNKFSPRVEKAVTIPQSTVKVGSVEIVEIVYSISPSEFYVQLTSDSEQLAALMADIATAFESDTGESLESPKKGQFCIAKYSEDQTWYRGRIESAETDSAHVLFVDYGNHEEVPNENIKVITDSQTSLPIQGVKCELFGYTSAGEEWTEEEILNFTTNCEGKKLKAQFVEKVFARDSFKVVLTDEGTGIVINSSPEARFNVSHESIEAAIAKMSSTDFCDVPVRLGGSMRVQISWFISPSHFYVHPFDQTAEFRAMMEHMQNVAKKGVSKPTTSLSVGDPIIARFKEDKVLYRARVKSAGFDPIVAYVDYGNCAKVEAGMTWEVEPQYATLPAQAICCALSGIIPANESWPKAGTSNIDSHFIADEFTCTFIKELDAENKVYAVQLMNGEKNISDQLVADSLAVEGSICPVQDNIDDGNLEMELALLVGQIFSVVVTHVESSAKFYVHLLPLQARVLLQEVEALNQDPNILEALPGDNLICGTFCITKNEDRYYRCRVVDATQPLVQFIDYGKVQEVKLEDLYSMPSGNLSKQPALSTECSLSLVEPISEELETQFKATPELKPYIIYINGVQNETLQVTLYEKDGQLSPYQQSDLPVPPNVNTICPLPILYSHHKVMISHAGEDSIYLHKLEFSANLEELLGNLYEFYNEKEYEEHEWKVGMYCAAKSSADEQWYRAKITAIESEVTVQYIDYGNYETLPSTSLRVLDSSFYEQHELAFKVRFHVQWLVPVETLLEITEEKVYNAVILRCNDSEWLAELISRDGINLTDSLVELGFVTVLEDSPFKRVVEGGRFVEGSDLSVSVSHIDSPSQIWLLIVSDIEVIEELQDRLQAAADKLKPLTRPSGLFAAKFTDGMWYRAVHMAVNTVRFIDYGNSDQVDMSDLKELTSDFAEPAEGYAVKCELFLEPKEGEWSDECKQKLEKLLIDTEEELSVHILEVKESSVVGNLFVGGKNVSDILVEQGLANIPQKKATVFVSHINSPNDFYVQLEGSETELEEIAETMSLAENFEDLIDIYGSLNDLVAAKYSVDEQWYRAKITKKEDEISVLFVDYGNSAVATEFKILPTEISTKPPLAKHCSLKLPSDVTEWSEAATEVFEELAAGGSNPLKIVQLGSGEPEVVVLFTSSGQSVADELKTVCVLRENLELDKSETVNVEEEDQEPSFWEPIYVSHAKSPEDFYVQSHSSLTDLETIVQQMCNFDTFTVINNPEEWNNKIVAAQSSADELWYRAKVLECSESGVSVIFVDYGNGETVPELRELPQELVDLPALAEHCALKLPRGVLAWSSEACEKFIDLVSDSSVMFEKCLLEAGEPNVISLRFSGEKIENFLSELCEIQPDVKDKGEDEVVDDLKKVSSEDKPQLNESAGDFFSAFVSHINSPNDFYVQKEGCETSLQEIANSLINVASFNDVSLDEKEKLIGKIVAGQYQFDSLWYRSKVLECDGVEAKVLFVDFGNIAIVTSLKELPQELVERRTTAQWCSLNRPKEIDDWSDSARTKFVELTGEGTVLLELRILNKFDALNIVDLYFEGQSVTEILTKLCDSKISGCEMSDLLLDSVLSEKDLQALGVDEQIEDDIIKKASDHDVNEDFEQGDETKMSKTGESISKRYNVDEHIVPGCVSQIQEITEEEFQDKNPDNSLTDEPDPEPNEKSSTEIQPENKNISLNNGNTLTETITQTVSDTPSRYNIDEHIIPGCITQSAAVNGEEILQSVDDAGTRSENEHKEIPGVNDKNTNQSDGKIEKDLKLKIISPAVEVSDQNDSETPKTPSRLNIDEHIVPGCVTQIQQPQSPPSDN